MRWYTEALNFFRDSNANWEAGALVGLGKVALAQDETDQAVRYIKQALGIPIALIDIGILIFDPALVALEAMALLAVARGKLEGNAINRTTAIRLLGATEAWHTQFFYTRLPRCGGPSPRSSCC